MIDEQAESAAENAFATYEFAGKELEPFGFELQCLAERFGLRSGSGLQAATIIVYLCSLTKKEARKLTRSYSDNFPDLLAEWAEKNKVTLRSENGKEVERIGDAIWDAIRCSESAPELKNTGATSSPNSLG